MDRSLPLTARPLWQIWLGLVALGAAALLARARLAPTPASALFMGIVAVLIAAWAIAWALRRLLDSDAMRRVATAALDGEAGTIRLGWRWLAAAVVSVVACLVLLEWAQPFYFVQDDNWAQFLPVIVQGGRAAFTGVAPVWNPAIFGGVPSAELGIYALTYPVTYLAYAIARLLGNDLMTLDVFAILHLTAGVLVTQALAARLGMRPAIATLAALSFTLCGFNLMVGRSWYYVLPTSLWLPAMLLGLVILQQRGTAPSPRWLIGTGLSIGLLFHAGNAQFWLYAVSMLWVLALAMALLGQLNLRQLAALLCATVLGIAIAAPLLLPQMGALAIDRGGGGCGIQVRTLFDMVLPYPLAGQVPHPCRWPPLLPQGYAGLGYAGTVTTVAAFVGLALLLLYRTGRRQWVANLWLPLMLVLLVAAVGHAAKVWTVLTWLPVFSRFAHPFKLLLFVELAAALGGGLVLDRVIDALPPARRGPVATGALAIGLIALIYSASVSDAAFFHYNDGGVPYRTLPAPIRSALVRPTMVGQRVIGVYAWRDDDASYSLAMPHNTADVYGGIGLLGYSDGGFENSLPQVARLLSHADADMLRAWGVRWVLVDDDFRHPAWPGDLQPTMKVALAAVRANGVPRLHADGVTLIELPDSAPLAMLETPGGKPTPLVIKVDAGGATAGLPVRQNGGTVTIGFLPLPRMQAYVDGVAVPLGTDRWGRATMRVAPGARAVALRYQPSWTPGWVLALIAGAIATIGYVVLRRQWRTTVPVPEAST